MFEEPEKKQEEGLLNPEEAVVEDASVPEGGDDGSQEAFEEEESPIAHSMEDEEYENVDAQPSKMPIILGVVGGIIAVALIAVGVLYIVPKLQDKGGPQSSVSQESVDQDVAPLPSDSDETSQGQPSDQSLQNNADSDVTSSEQASGTTDEAESAESIEVQESQSDAPTSEQQPAPVASTPSPNQDSDRDGLTDVEERRLGTNPFDADSDNDGLSDWDEVRIYRTKPLSADTDGDGYADGDEISNGYNPNGSGPLIQLPE